MRLIHQTRTKNPGHSHCVHDWPVEYPIHTLPWRRCCGTQSLQIQLCMVTDKHGQHKRPACEVQMLYFSLGDFVAHPNQPDWGQGQVQSIVGMNVTVNFEHAGKQMINCEIIHLVKVNSPQRDWCLCILGLFWWFTFSARVATSCRITFLSLFIAWICGTCSPSNNHVGPKAQELRSAVPRSI